MDQGLLYKRAIELAQQYVDKYTIPHMREIIKNNNKVGVGKYLNSLYSKVLSGGNDSMVVIGVFGIEYSKYISGPMSEIKLGFKAGEKTANKLSNWVKAKNINWDRVVNGKKYPMSAMQTAWAIMSKWRHAGRAATNLYEGLSVDESIKMENYIVEHIIQEFK